MNIIISLMANKILGKLGLSTSYPQTYDPSVLFKISRSEKRSEIKYNKDIIKNT